MSGEYRLSYEEKKNIRKYVQEKKQDDDYIKNLQTQASKLYAIRGPLCDSEGFYQHYGECWSDALQHMLNNADGIKERMQDFYIHTFLDFDAEFDIYELADEASRLWAILYIREAQKRFLRHYITEVSRRNIVEEKCERIPTAVVARNALQALSKNPEMRKKGSEGVSSAIFGMIEKSKGNVSLRGARPTVEAYINHTNTEAGGKEIDITLLLNVYGFLLFPEANRRRRLEHEKLFFDRNTFDPSDFEEQIQDTTAILFSASFKTRTMGHQLVFYQCGGKQYLYEDNEGAFPFLWKEFLSKVVEFGDTEKPYSNPNIYLCPLQVVQNDKLLYRAWCFPIFYYEKHGKKYILCLIESEFHTIELDESFSESITLPLTFSVGEKQYKIKVNLLSSLAIYHPTIENRYHPFRFIHAPVEVNISNKENPLTPIYGENAIRIRRENINYKGGTRKSIKKKQKKSRRNRK